MNMKLARRALSGALLATLLTAGQASAAAVQQNIALSESGTDGSVVSCEPGLPDACHWRFESFANGSGLPYGYETLPVVVDLRTSGTWDAQGCQPLADDSTVTFHRRPGQADFGWRKRLGGAYCKVGDDAHVLHATFVVEPATRAGRYHRVTGTGTMTLQDGVGNTPGSTGPWDAQESGTLTY
ncbi:hypothetical protein [Streptomyces sp. c-19]|uniref:hypothetical protein n=1 Tax=Streptomyces sp. c-19 TaxID=2789275 RepID=UPI00397EEB86